MNQTQEEHHLNKIRIFYEKRLNRELSDAEILEIHQSLHYLGKAIIRFERMKNERDGN